jgi:release factor glutamine methyltransferase
VGELLAAATTTLTAAGVPSPRVDAELLLAHVLDLPRSRLVLAGPPDVAARGRYAALLERRRAREPLQHLVGTAAFRTVELAVGPGVFVPRPETELLVDAVLPTLAGGGVAVDLCAGSGALAIALAAETPDSVDVHAVEADPDALAWLSRNAAGTRVHVHRIDVTAGPLLTELAGAVDVVVANPPYVPAGAPVAAEVTHDPPVAVFAGVDGLDVLPSIVARAAELLTPGGVLAVEHDDSHGSAVPGLLVADGRWDGVVAHLDLTGRPRFATARRR